MKRSKDYSEQKTLLKTIELEGFILEKDYLSTADALFIDSLKEPIAKYLEENISDKNVTVRYWISNIKQTKEKIQINSTLMYLGLLESEFSEQYRDYTGYLWTDEEINVGGHDLLEELKASLGKYIILEIEVYK